MNNSTNIVSSTERFSVLSKIFIVTIKTCVSILTVGGNALVFLAYHKNKHLQKSTNYFILSLATADIIIGFFSVNFYTLYLVYGYWPLGIYACDFYLTTDYWCSQSSIFSLVVISIDRFLAINYPISYRNKHNKKRLVLIIIAVTWILSFIIWVPWIISYQFITGERTLTGKECYVQFLYESPYLTLSTAIFAYFGPITLMGILYGLILLQLKKRRENLTYLTKFKNETKDAKPTSVKILDISSKIIPNGSQNNSADSINKEKQKAKFNSNDDDKAITLILFIFFAFLITWLPYNLFAVMAPFCSDCIPTGWWDFGYILCYVNSTLNPFCYALGNRKFREAFKNIIYSYKRKIVFCNKGSVEK